MQICSSASTRQLGGLCSFVCLAVFSALQLAEGRNLQDALLNVQPSSRLSAFSNLYTGDTQHQRIPGIVPVCSSAYAIIQQPGLPDDRSLWGRYLPVSIGGVTSPSGQPVVIAIDSILQNEPAYSQHSQDACPDAQVNGLNSLFLRYENGEAGRQGNTGLLQKGRTYYVGFTARNQAGLSCTGMVPACVPLEGQEDCVATANDMLYDSRVCSPQIDLYNLD